MKPIVINTDIWAMHRNGYFVVIPTNTRYSANRAHMGAGLAEAAAIRYPDVPKRYAAFLAAGKAYGCFSDHRLLMVPTKLDWKDKSNYDLIHQACVFLSTWSIENPNRPIAVPMLGCGYGELEPDKVLEILLEELQPTLIANMFAICKNA